MKSNHTKSNQCVPDGQGVDLGSGVLLFKDRIRCKPEPQGRQTTSPESCVQRLAVAVQPAFFGDQDALM